MPRYFFHLHPGRISDTEGKEFANAEEARREAWTVARELARNRTASTEERIEVLDEHGAVTHEQPLVVN
jgi:hypothetical protein